VARDQYARESDVDRWGEVNQGGSGVTAQRMNPERDNHTNPYGN
jgi:hypothetical protein